MYCGNSVPIVLGGFVFLWAVIWWLNTRLDEILKEIKKK